MNDLTLKQRFIKKARSVYAAVERKAVPVAASVSVALGVLTMSVSAEESGAAQTVLTEINSGDVISNMMPFVNAAIPIMAVVGGIKLGRSFLRSSFH